MPFMTTQMDLEGIILIESSQRKTNTILSNLYVELKKKPHRQKEHFGGCQKYGVEDG